MFDEFFEEIRPALLALFFGAGTTNEADIMGFTGFAIGGQSNGRGAGQANLGGDGIDLNFDYEDPRIVQRGRVSPYTDKFIKAEWPLAHIQEIVERVGLGLLFSKLVLRYISKKEICLLPGAEGGTGFSNNYWNPDEVNFNLMVESVNWFLAENTENEMGAFLWHFGEADALNSMTEAAHNAAMIAMLDRLYSDTNLSIQQVPFIIGELAPDWYVGDADREAINNSIVSLRDNYPGVVVISSIGLVSNNGDEVHFTAESMREFDRRYFLGYQFAKGLLNSPVPESILSLTAQAGDQQVDISYLGAFSIVEIISYDIRYKLVSASTWSQINLSGLSQSFTGLTNGEDYEFEVRANNQYGAGPWLSTGTVTPDTSPVPVDYVFQLTFEADPFVDTGPNTYAITQNLVTQVDDGAPHGNVYNGSNANNYFLNTTADLSASSWSVTTYIKRLNTSNHCYILSGNSASEDHLIWIRSSGNALELQLDFTGVATILSGGTVPLNTWTLIGVDYDHSTRLAHLYVNGTEVASGTLDVNPFAGVANFEIGKIWTSAGGSPMQLNAYKVWDRVLTPAEHLSLVGVYT